MVSALEENAFRFFSAGKSEASVGLNLLSSGTQHSPKPALPLIPSPLPRPKKEVPSELVITDLQIVLLVPARRRANSVCRLLKAIRAGPGSRLGVLKVIGRMPVLCHVDPARIPALSLCKVCSSLKVE